MHPSIWSLILYVHAKSQQLYESSYNYWLRYGFSKYSILEIKKAPPWGYLLYRYDRRFLG